MGYENFTTFVGIDQSLNSTGYYISGRKKGIIVPKKGVIGGQRLRYIFNRLDDILVTLIGNTRSSTKNILVCMEGYAYNYRVGKVFELGEVGGIVKLVCAQRNIQIVSVPPADIKKFVTGSATASKSKMMFATKEKQNDVADAHGLYDIAYGLANTSTITMRCQMEVLHNCKKNTILL